MKKKMYLYLAFLLFLGIWACSVEDVLEGIVDTAKPTPCAEANDWNTRDWSCYVFFRDDMSKSVDYINIYMDLKPCGGYMEHYWVDESTQRFTIPERPKDPVCIYGYSVNTYSDSAYFVGADVLQAAIPDSLVWLQWLEDVDCYFEGKWKDFWPDTIWID